MAQPLMGDAAAAHEASPPQGAYTSRMTSAAKMETKDLNVYYGATRAIKDISLEIPERQVTALMGPSGCGKSTFLRALNRMHDLTPSARVDGKVILDGHNVYDPETDVIHLRQKVGMVLQRPNPFPKSIFENVAYVLHVLGRRTRAELAGVAQRSLSAPALRAEAQARLTQTPLRLTPAPPLR